MTAGDFAQVLTAIAAVGGVYLTWLKDKRSQERNTVTNAKLDVLHQTTNSLSERNEQLAKDVGIAIGKKEEKDHPS